MLGSPVFRGAGVRPAGGDSFTFGYAPFESNWGTVLEDRLKVRVLKCGVIGHGARQEFIKASRVIARVGTSPKLIVVGYFINDVTDDYKLALLRLVDGKPVLPTLDPLTGERSYVDGSLTWRDRLVTWLSSYSVVYGATKHALKAFRSRYLGSTEPGRSESPATRRRSTTATGSSGHTSITSEA